MFYIEGRFYIDGAEDLSEPARTRAAARYLFTHDGDCEHAIVFECGLASERDELRPERYPLLCYRSKDATERCSVCNLAATHEVAGCATADTFPLYLCKDCRSEYFFDAKGYLRPSMAGFSEWPLHQRPTLALGGDGGDEPETGPVLAEAVAE
ncbi:hypothetical protein EMIHUDRAFT_196116 [Emiliania huxleyi CCMP1516]|uniref:snRNA-activating protein complex subunit 3 n=2 Tax=Emiliania huxleyi TaxID=2903 RepID=A0A0D3J3I6_EMIH1|nr:hypothetical protein EMIHUDRAFT_196116 [Emiliania huxleyi CCMP1516]EOD18071.1 hypothetical protein EMIHUDRAFT_196116 [Emiliania huxleyi CCMP1516]|eukprot:XP_005770500.1 hypothetical protein EMIHUDRAFT_196116 [Emiliania huxleyi CCMP1516]